MTYKNFTLETDTDGIALITWDMPGKSMNVIDQSVMAELDAIITGGEVLREALEEATDLKFEVFVPTSYAAVIEGMCASPGDTMGFPATLAYVIANARCGVDASMMSIRFGWDHYWAQFIVARDSDIVISVVHPRAALDAAAGFAPAARAGQTYVDLNSTTPMVKTEIQRLLGPLQVEVVDGVMTGAGTTVDGYRIPILLAGPAAGDVQELFAAIGFNASVVSETLGSAAVVKMVRGIVIKGLDATCMEARLVAHRYGVHDELLASLSESLDRMPIREFIDMLLQTHPASCERRSIEAADIEATVLQAGVEPIMATATRRLFERSVRHNIGSLSDVGADEATVGLISQLIGESE